MRNCLTPDIKQTHMHFITHLLSCIHYHHLLMEHFGICHADYIKVFRIKSVDTDINNGKQTTRGFDMKEKQ